MLGKLQENQRELFRTRLEDLINPNAALYVCDECEPFLTIEVSSLTSS